MSVLDSAVPRLRTLFKVNTGQEALKAAATTYLKFMSAERRAFEQVCFHFPFYILISYMRSSIRTANSLLSPFRHGRSFIIILRQPHIHVHCHDSGICPAPLSCSLVVLPDI